MKHFAVYSVPKGRRDAPDRTDPHVTERQMRELFLYPFKRVIRAVNPLGAMASYNDYNGVPIAANHKFLYDILRGRLGFTGYVVSDSGAVKFIHSKHHVAPTRKDAIRQWIEAGGDVRTDFTPPAVFIKPLRALIKEHKIPMRIINRRVREVLSVKFRLGLFDHPYVQHPDESANVIGNKKHRKVALQAALESMVLLKNDQHTLPLSKHLGSIVKAKTVDAIIAVVGGNRHTVGEFHSRTSLDLPGHQRELLQALAKTGKPIVVVLINGRPLTINWANKHIPAILEAWFPGEAAGTAVARTLFGDYNPGGKLPITFPKTVGQVLYNFPHKPGSQAPQKGSHTRVNGALYPFGYGLSYTHFKYANLNVTPATIKPGQSISVSFRLTNVGKRAGDAIPQLYLKERYAVVIPFDKVLRGFERVHLKPGQSKAIHFKLNAKDMQILDRQMKWQVEPGAFEVQIGSSSTDVRLKDEFNVTG
jgi:hypothetical protein